jgi:hypothetical protein
MIYRSPGSSYEPYCLLHSPYEFLQRGKKNPNYAMGLCHCSSHRISDCSHFGDVSKLCTSSITDPGNRRHAVMATLIKDCLEVPAYY